MKFTFDARPAEQDDITIHFVSRENRDRLPGKVADAEFSGKPHSHLYRREQKILHVGVGESSRIDAQVLRSAAGSAIMFLKKIGAERAMVNLTDWPQFAGAVVEGALLADYRFEQFKVKQTPRVKSVRVSTRAADVTRARRAGERAEVIANATNLAREIGNQPGNLLYPKILAERALKIADATGLRATILNEKKLRAGKFGGLLAVGGGSAQGPRLILLEHRRGPKSQKPLALIGKAITFDTGGISIKQAANMEEMIFDKCGGMAVLGAMAGIAELGLKRNVVGVIASAENMPGANAYRPGDIVTTFDGKHVEIVNTDAEGRVVLADAIGYARKALRAAAIVDLATLTGACGVALGEHAAGFWSSDDALKASVLEAAERAGERIWPMPLFSEHEEQIKSAVAHLKNSGGRLGGACTAAAFLRAFAEETPWAHLDIAYTASRDKDQSDMARGATGFGVRMLIELAEAWT